ncbi:MAG: hypothetical protein PHU94_01495 [Bacilli bacterium]|nr:hypothetical protein [Bacilli bacterium]MDD4733953.1 hypothetical protein [Bacilli bacterium]
MKKIILIPLLIMFIGCKKEEELKIPIKNNDQEEIIETIPEYVDNNYTKIGLYKKTNNRRFLTDEINGSWGIDVDITNLSVFLTNEESLNGDPIKGIWANYLNLDTIKIGYLINFKKSNGEEINHMILSPEISNKYVAWIQVYIYDDIHQTNYYSHLTKGNDSTIMTTIKLTTGGYFNDIVSPIKLSVFSYDGNDDFDPETNLYRGNSIFTTTINIKK